MWEKGGRVFRNNYKGHMEKTKVGVEAGEGVGDGCGGERMIGCKCRQLYLHNNKIILKNKVNDLCKLLRNCLAHRKCFSLEKEVAAPTLRSGGRKR